MRDAFDYLDLHDYRRRVSALYRDRAAGLSSGERPEAVLNRFREGRDRLFADHPQSALDDRQKQQFTALSYFPFRGEARVRAIIYPDVEQYRTVVEAGEESIPMTRIALLRFTYEGQPGQLSMFWLDLYGGGLFLPFRDSTAPAETYGGGRYLFDTIKGSDLLTSTSGDDRREISLDFNYAYNPSCAYNPRWVCPLAPPENRLSFPIRAGERIPPALAA
jgi:uncharacterized protein (DUF1684 family)